MKFQWDDANEEHILRHGVTRHEAEEVLVDQFGEILDSDRVGEEIRYTQIGATLRGRLLIVVFTLRNEYTIRPITAFDSDPYRARMYRNGTIL